MLLYQGLFWCYSTIMRSNTDKIGILGVVLGFIGFAIVLIHFYHGPFNKPDPAPSVSAKSFIQSLIKNKPAEPDKTSQFNTDNIITYVSIVLAFLALIAGAITYIRKTNKELAYTSMVLGAATILFHFLLVGIVIAIMFMAIVLYFKS